MDEFKNLDNGEQNESKSEQETRGSFVLDGSSAETKRVEHEYTPSVAPPVSSYSPYSYTPKKQKSSNGFSLATVIVSVLLAAVVGLGGGIVGTLAVNKIYQNNAQPNNSIANGFSGGEVNINVQNLEATIGEAVAQKVTPSVVGIRTTVSVQGFFGGTQESSGEGSGVIYTSDGYIITNYHVISNAVDYGKSSKIEVFLSGNTETGYEATVVGYNISNDLAVVKINGKNLNAIEWADSSKLKVGQQAMAIGNPGGLEFMGSATWGIISGLNRVLSTESDGSTTQLIQTDAAINPGNSGGALVNTEGKLIGINSSKLVSESVEGMGFAIPSNTVKEICDRIIAKENNPDPYLGITVSTRYTPEILQGWNLPVGAVVYSVSVDSPADEAGIQRDDIITEFNGNKVTHYNLISDYLAECKPGDKVSIKIYRPRSGKYIDGSITIGSNNSQ